MIEVSFEYLASITDPEELKDVLKIIRLEKGQLSAVENQVQRVQTRLSEENNAVLQNNLKSIG